MGLRYLVEYYNALPAFVSSFKTLKHRVVILIQLVCGSRDLPRRWVLRPLLTAVHKLSHVLSNRAFSHHIHVNHKRVISTKPFLYHHFGP